MILQYTQGCKSIADAKPSETSGVCRFSLFLQNSLYYSKITVYILYPLINAVIFRVLIKVMSSSLNFYYRTQRRDLWLLFIASTFSYVTVSIIYVIDRILLIELSTLNYFRDDESVTSNQIIVYLCIQSFLVINLMFYIYYNIRNLNFRKCLWDIMKGYGIQDQYPTASRFVRKSIRPQFIRTSLMVDSDSDSSDSFVSTSSPPQNLAVWNDMHRGTTSSILTTSDPNAYKTNYLKLKAAGSSSKDSFKKHNT